MTRRGFLSNLFRRGLPGSHAKADWNVDRRGFVGWILSALSAVIMWPFTPSAPLVDPREALLAEALKSDAGRQALCASMVEPIRMRLNYEGIGRKILMVQPLPPGALARYERDVRSVARELADRDDIKIEAKFV